jgi:hypothetical protein
MYRRNPPRAYDREANGARPIPKNDLTDGEMCPSFNEDCLGPPLLAFVQLLMLVLKQVALYDQGGVRLSISERKLLSL